MNTNRRREWLKERKAYIGGSDISCILGLNKYRSALDLYLDKTTNVIDESTNEAAYWGIQSEDMIAKEYAKRTGLSVENPIGVMRHPEYSFLGANIDRWVIAGESRAYHVLECKTAHFLKNKEWGEEGSDQIPESYLCQVAYYSAICNVKKVDIAVLIGGQEFRIYTYKKNKDFEDKLIRAAVVFWNNYVEQGIPPEPSDYHEIPKLFPRSNGETIEADNEIVSQIEELKSLKAQEKSIGLSRSLIECKIKAKIGENEALINQNGELLATWKSNKPRLAFDSKKLMQEQQDIYQKYLIEKEPTRTLLIK